jgi:hypothetical protein
MLVMSFLKLLVQGNLQGIHSPRKNKNKRALLQVCESFVGTQEIHLAMVCE